MSATSSLLEATELRLGLPGNAGESSDIARKRGFHETVDLKLNLSSPASTKEVVSKPSDHKHDKTAALPSDPAKPPPKAQVVGWPPVRSFRKKIIDSEKSLVKVSVDGAPYLRKVDLKMYTSYHDLSEALGNMFSSFTIGNCGLSQGVKDFMNENKLMDLLHASDTVPTYEDKDGDWMLVGDVPWEMFVQSCKRLRIMKGTEAIGLAPRAVEKCKERN